MIVDKIPWKTSAMDVKAAKVSTSEPAWIKKKREKPAFLLDQPSMVSKYFSKLVQFLGRWLTSGFATFKSISGMFGILRMVDEIRMSLPHYNKCL